MSQPPRVLLVVRPAQGGIRQHVLNLLDGIDPAQATLSVAAPPAFVRDVLAHPHLHASIPLDIAARVSLARDLLASGRLARLVPQFADVVHAHGVRAGWIAALAHRHRPFPLILTAHNLAEAGLMARLGLPLIAYHCARILAVSGAVEESLTALAVPRAKIEVIPNGIDLAHFSLSPEDRREARAALELPDTAFVVAAAARFSPEKGLDILLGAAAQRAGMTFRVAGDGPLKSTLQRQAPANTKLLGRLADVRPLLSAADVFAVPSRREGQGIAALEAMAAGVPVVASRVGGLAAMLRDGETALLVPPNDPDALAAALSRLKSDSRLRQKLVDNASRLVQDQYNLPAMLEAVQRVYSTVRV